jgi:succinate dehydrogenase / fumarate reductase, cytochrome b subunit
MANGKAQIERPMSPHLQVYRWSWTFLMSGFHRVTGMLNYFGTVLVAIWLLAMATSPAAYDWVRWFFASPIGLLVLFGYTWTLMHHLLGGVRHLIWDFGYGLEPATRFNMARFTLFGSITLTLLLWVLAFVVR